MKYLITDNIKKINNLININELEESIKLINLEYISNIDLNSILIFINFSTFNSFIEKLNTYQLNNFIFNKQNKFIFSMEEIYTNNDIEIFKNTLVNDLINGYILPTQQSFFNLSSKAYNDEIAFKDKIYISSIGINQNNNWIDSDFNYIIPLSIGKEELFYLLKYNFNPGNNRIGITLANDSLYSINEIKESIHNLNNKYIEFIPFINVRPRIGYIFPFSNYNMNYSQVFFDYIYNSNRPIFSLKSGCLNELNIYQDYKSNSVNDLIDMLNNFRENKISLDLNILSWKNIFLNIFNWIEYLNSGKINKEIIMMDNKICKIYNRIYYNYSNLLYDYY